MRRSSFRLLPDDTRVGWTAYLWLIYLGQIPIALVFSRSSALVWSLQLAGIAVFLGLYFRAHWVEGRRLAPLVLAMAGLGGALTAVHPAAVVYFIYAAAFSARLGPPALVRRWVLGLALALAAAAALLRVPIQFWAPALIFTIVIGALMLGEQERERMRAKLALAQEEVERLATVAERERIARDLHDVLGHSLALITLKAELASRLVRTQPERAEAELGDLVATSRQAMAQVRETVRGYRKVGLEEALASTRLAAEAAGLALEVEREPLALPVAVEHALALALREAVTNALRHAGATTLRVALRRQGEHAELRVEDDGRGGPVREGGGLTGMRERLEALGGTVALEAARGVRLLVRVPAGEAAP
jgi:two-component system, NarL family, sensor histidine kinase DesK